MLVELLQQMELNDSTKAEKVDVLLSPGTVLLWLSLQLVLVKSVCPLTKPQILTQLVTFSTGHIQFK